MPREEDPFWEPPEDILIGTANVFLQSLAYALDFDDKLTVTDYKVILYTNSLFWNNSLYGFTLCVFFSLVRTFDSDESYLMFRELSKRLFLSTSRRVRKMESRWTKTISLMIQVN